MKTTIAPNRGIGPFSRRGFMKGAAVLAAAAQSGPLGAATGQIVAYVGAYTDRDGNALYIYDVNPSDGTLTRRMAFTDYPSPSSLALDPKKKFLYAVNEISNFNGSTNGSVTAFAIQPNGDLKFLNVVSSQGGGPAFLSVDPSGKWVLAANYGAGSVAVLPIKTDGSVGEATDLQVLMGPLGPHMAQDGPPFSFADSGHDASHAHMAQTDPAGNYVLVNDLGTDRIFSFKFDKTAGKLSPNGFVQANPGAGPRHLEFHPNGRWVYVINEEASTLDFMSYDAGFGSLTLQQTIPSLPSGYQGTNYPSEIHVTDDGLHIYAANRLHNSVALFSIDQGSGAPTWIREFWTRGDYPRHFAIEPNGNFLYVCHSRSDNITTFGVDRGTGTLNFTGKYTGVFNPSKIVFVAL
ncbi:MAG: lactonase family protein [Acidobacteriota bacterium]|nr:lactonase family protein [Acidobacteriota bacterium]